MKSGFILSVAWLGLVFLKPGWALDLTPKPVTQILDGYKIHYFSFEDGDQRVEYGPPHGWSCVGSPAKLTISNPEVRTAESIFTVTPIVKPAPFTQIDLKAFKDEVIATLPPKCENPVLLENTGRHSIGNREYYTADITYVLYGQKYRVRTTFLNLGKTGLKIVCTAPFKEFETFANTLDQSLYSWHWVEKNPGLVSNQTGN